MSRRRTSNSEQLYDCDRCMFTFKKKSLRKQRGMLLCSSCWDEVLEIAPLDIPWDSPRDNSLSVDAVNTATTFTITTAGITALQQSQPFDRAGTVKHYFMRVVGSPTTITANPQIVAGAAEYVLVLQGTDDTNYVTLQAGSGTDLATDMVLKEGSTISLVYNTTSALWCETSRS